MPSARERRRRAIRTRVATRAANRAMLKRWQEVDLPTNRRIEGLVNFLLKGRTISLCWNPLGGVTGKLMRGAMYGELIGVKHGGKIWTVLPEGYKRPQDFHAGFWEALYP